MPRLTQWQRDRVVNGILKDTFEARARALVKREAALAVRVILDRYGRDAFDRFDAVPPGWLTTSKRFLVGRGTANHYLNLEEARPLPHELAMGHFGLDDRPRLAARFDDLVAAQKQLSRYREQLQWDVRNALAQFSTEAALRDGWSEGYVYLAVPSASAHPVPAVRVEDLNARIAALKEAA